MKLASFLFLFEICLASANVHDCWDQEKLKRMKFNNGNDLNADSGLNQFSKMVKCLSGQQGKGISTGLNQDWGKWANNPSGGQFVPNWDQNNRNRNNWNTDHQRVGQQPSPGVHPDDWGRPGGSPGWRRQGERPTAPPPPPPQWNNKDERQQRKRNRKEKQRRRNEPGPLPPPGPGLEPDLQRPAWGSQNPIDSAPMGRDYIHMNQEESAAVSLSRKYGYAIMALSVVVLAVLMVATIFCCNSSNSTMSQAANHTLPVNQYDTYSIYSYKGGLAGADTLRSTGTLGGASMHTETLKSTRSMASRASPQYRVSDIDPDFARRFKDNQQY